MVQSFSSNGVKLFDDLNTFIFRIFSGKLSVMNNKTSPSPHLSRRSFLYIAALAGATGATRFFPLTTDTPRIHRVRKSVPMMGTVLNLTLYSRDRDQAEAAMTATLTRMQELENKLSRHQLESEVATLNQTGSLERPSKDLRTVLELADSVNKKTAGAFDITVLPLLTLYQKNSEQLLRQPDRIRSLVQSMGHKGLRYSLQQIQLDRAGSENAGITLDGIGKGYIVDQGVTTLNSFGFQQVLVEAGGDLLVSGNKPQGNPWRIGIRKPRPEMPGELLTVAGENMAVATSGDYFQPFSPDLLHHHIINPHTG
ncbi:MAG: FAD:protein FMN transferase [Candidatus Electrothrix sp. ATG2]|nr:FAD:protein FMN transferase [Candidatus Electrothrix sp. ATG2]